MGDIKAPQQLALSNELTEPFKPQPNPSAITTKDMKDITMILESFKAYLESHGHITPRPILTERIAQLLVKLKDQFYKQ